MKLVETETEGPVRLQTEDGPPTKPRPEHRRVYVSLVLTLGVLIGTVVAVYVFIPERANLRLQTAVAQHEATPQSFELTAPSPAELNAWSLGLLGKDVPWPKPSDGLTIVGARSLEILRRPAGYVRFAVGAPAAATQVSLVVMKAHDTPPRTARETVGNLLVLSWRNGKWTMIAIGEAATEAQWLSAIRPQ